MGRSAPPALRLLGGGAIRADAIEQGGGGVLWNEFATKGAGEDRSLEPAEEGAVAGHLSLEANGAEHGRI